ncbi:DUF5362 family protein [Pedobacter sp. PLR]|uniref:DUF5362 family protein n=1 Tax=Pedobacter sp. PLR TaxID=2994465 RepID=UPI0022465CA3|nr:DUF5362 family protein [Pedobacter sp. PLR]MCX2451835.1 DUF5362 family protein [Pedobacter sp. PLR]
MEEFEETKPDHTEVETLIITEDIRSDIYETAKWAKFLSIVGFVGCVLMIILSLTMPAMLASLNKLGNSPLGNGNAAATTATYLITGILYFYPSLMLFKYANSAQHAVLYMDQDSLGEAMAKMKSLFKFVGIMTIVMLAILAITVLLLIVVAIGAAT